MYFLDISQQICVLNNIEYFVLDLCYVLDIVVSLTCCCVLDMRYVLILCYVLNCLSPQMNFCLTEDEIMEDLRIINKISGKPVMKKPLSTSLQLPPSVVPEIIYEARIDDGKLYFDRRW